MIMFSRLHCKAQLHLVAVLCFTHVQTDMVQGLKGSFPAVSPTASAKMSELRISDTDLQQCSASHVAALTDHRDATMWHAGSSSQMASDNVTGCLPDFLQFCEPAWADPESHIMCPPVAFRRPTQAAQNNLAKVIDSA